MAEFKRFLPKILIGIISLIVAVSKVAVIIMGSLSDLRIDLALPVYE